MTNPGPTFPLPAGAAAPGAALPGGDRVGQAFTLALLAAQRCEGPCEACGYLRTVADTLKTSYDSTDAAGNPVTVAQPPALPSG